MYFCLGCLACMTACPAGVNCAELFEHARAEVESRQLLNPRRSAIRWFTVKWLFMDHRRLTAVGRGMRLYQELGIQSLVRGSGVLKLLPKRLRELEAMAPKVQPAFSNELIGRITPPVGGRRHTVAMLTGCAQDLIFSDVNRDTVEVLARHNGCEVHTPPDQPCCGSLHAHNGEWTLAQTLARRMIDLLPPERFDAIITNAGGCGSHLKHYEQAAGGGSALRGPGPVVGRESARYPRVFGRRRMARALVVDGARADARDPPRVVPSVARPESGSATPAVARSIPGLKLVELPEANWCCGSAGIYNLTQPEMAGQLLERKMGIFGAPEWRRWPPPIPDACFN